MITVEVIGGKKLAKRLKVLGDEAPDAFKEVVDDTATFAHAQAMNHINKNVNTGTGHLKQSMYVDLSGEDFAIVGNRADYAPYVEFGTGKKVIVPPEFSQLASRMQSRPTKSFKEGLEAIKDWCKRLGIEVKNAYPIFMSILRTGVRPRPFLYPAFQMGKRYMEKETEKMIKKLTKTK